MESLIYTNPFNGEQIDLSPLMKLMADRRFANAGCENIVKRIQNVHDFLTTHVPTLDGSTINPQVWVDATILLVELRNTFSAMHVPVEGELEEVEN